MASELQKKKLMHLFNTFYDFNKDGVIEWVDFESCVETVCTCHGWDKNGDRAKACLATLKQVWSGLQKYADKNADNQVTPQEWFQMWDECFQSKSALPEWQLSYCNFFFDISDTSGDGVVDLDEYKKIYKNFGFTDKECETAFAIISESGKTELNRANYAKLWNEYIMSDKADAKGNHLFGEVKNH